MKSLILLLFCICISFFVVMPGYGQCGDCNVTVIGNNDPDHAIQNNDSVCILGTRTVPLDLLNRTNLTLCFDNSAVFTGGFVGLANDVTITNYGQLGTSELPINLTLGAGSVFTNLGSMAVASLQLNTGGILNNMTQGSIDVANTTTINGSLNNQGFINFASSVLVTIGETIINNGSINALSLMNNGTVDSSEGTINIGQDLSNSGNFKVMNGSVGGDLINFNNIIIFNALNINGDLQNKNLANISAGSQPSYLSSGGIISNFGCLNSPTGTLLYVNKNPSEEGTCINGDVIFGVDPIIVNPNCLTILEVPQYVQGGYQYFQKVYMFTCDTDWPVPGAPSGEEELLSIDATILIVGGGGGGGMGKSAGGGGGGGVNFISSKALTPNQNINIKIGKGGDGSQDLNRRGADGLNSYFGSDSALGGGGGGSNANDSNAAQRNGMSGGSGGGGSFEILNGLPGDGLMEIFQNDTIIWGNKGAKGGSFSYRVGQSTRIMGFGGGGGGAKINGLEGKNTGNQGVGRSLGGNGGEGYKDNITGNIFSGGGGGTSFGGQGSTGPGFGGSGVGGDANNDGVGFNGVSGGSGGGAGLTRGGNGANGVVLVTQFFRILPVNFINFSSEYLIEKRSTKLSWSTSKEWENSHFDIERSLDGTKTFSKIGEVAGMGWTDEVTEYVYEDDRLPLTGGNVFYRLKQVDFNGRFEYSDIVAVRVPNVHFTKGVWRAYPNPSQGADFQLELVDISQYQDEPVTFRVLSSTLSSNETTYNTLQELNSAASAIMGNAPNGLWIIELQWGNKVERIKVMKK